MATRATARFVRVAPRKARLVTDLIRGKDLREAQQILDFCPRAAAGVVSKVLASAAANAENNDKLSPDELFVSTVYVDEGPTLKRFRPRALGRATRINKRTSHITVVLDEKEPQKAQVKRRRLRRGRTTGGKDEKVTVEEEATGLEPEPEGAEPARKDAAGKASGKPEAVKKPERKPAGKAGKAPAAGKKSKSGATKKSGSAKPAASRKTAKKGAAGKEQRGKKREE